MEFDNQDELLADREAIRFLGRAIAPLAPPPPPQNYHALWHYEDDLNANKNDFPVWV